VTNAVCDRVLVTVLITQAWRHW